MARRPHIQNVFPLQAVPVTERQVDDAWQAYAATQRMAAGETALLENEYFTALQDTAYARFLRLLEAL